MALRLLSFLEVLARVLSGIRQAMAAAMFLAFGLELLEEKKYSLYYISIVVCIHSRSITYFPDTDSYQVDSGKVDTTVCTNSVDSGSINSIYSYSCMAESNSKSWQIN